MKRPTGICFVVGLALLGGCATKKYVAQTVDPVNAKVSQVDQNNQKTQKQLDEAEPRISAADEKATSADNRATDVHAGNNAALFDRGERGWLQYRTCDVLDDLSVALTFGAGRNTFRVGLERIPLLLALGQRFPGQQVMQVIVAVADEHRSETRRPDAMSFPEIERGALETLEQSGQAARYASVDA